MCESYAIDYCPICAKKLVEKESSILHEPLFFCFECKIYVDLDEEDEGDI